MKPNFYPLALYAIKSTLSGLPSFCRLTMYELLEYCDYAKGTISISTLDAVARNDFHVDSAPGRKREEITADTLRNALRTIKKFKSEHFIFKTINQRIIIEMPFIRELYEQCHAENQEVAAVNAVDLNTDKTHTSIDENAYFVRRFSGDDAVDVAAASSPNAINVCAYAHAKIKPNNYKTNKQTNSDNDSFESSKQTIRSDFYPTQDTIEQALSKGFSKVTSDIEIKRFILYNQANATLWADYNPVFLAWLERDHNPNEEPAILRKKTHEQRTPHQVTAINPTIAEAIRRNKQIIADEERKHAPHDFIEGEYFESVAIPY